MVKDHYCYGHRSQFYEISGLVTIYVTNVLIFNFIEIFSLLSYFFDLFNIKFKTFSNKTNEIMPYVKTKT